MSAWVRYRDKFNNLSLRERLWVWAGGAATAGFLVHGLFLGPVLAERDQLAKALLKQGQDLQATATQLGSSQAALAAGPDAANRERRRLLEKQLQEVEAELRAVQKDLVAPDKMAKLLEELLGRSRGVKLVGLRTLAAEGKETGSAAAEGGGQEKTEKALYRHGVEITVEGGYLDLLRYLIQVEKLPWQMLWGKLRLRVVEYPTARLSVTVHTLSLDKAWLVM